MIRRTFEELLPPLTQGSDDPLAESNAPWRQAMTEFVDFAAQVTPNDWEQFVAETPQIMDWQPRLAPIYSTYIRAQEVSEAESLLSGSEAGAALKLQDGFARHAYDRVRDLFDFVDFGRCRRLVMVGCGSLPVTLLHIRDRTDVPEMIGLDTDSRAVDLVNRQVELFGMSGIRAQCSDGRHYSYEEADVVYVANLVAPKAAVLKRVADTLADGACVVLRDPFCAGELLAEKGRSSADPRLRATGEAGKDGHFLSKHVYFERQA